MLPIRFIILKMCSIQKPKTQNPNFSRNSILSFFSRRAPSTLAQLYHEGVQAIVAHRRILEIKNDSILLAIDLLRSFINKGGELTQENLIAVCIACLLSAGKVNQVYPPRVEEITQAFDFFQGNEWIIELEAVIMRQIDYEFPWEQNLLGLIEEGNSWRCEKGKKLQECVKIIYKYISEPLLLSIDNSVIAEAVIHIVDEIDQQHRRIPSKLQTCNESLAVLNLLREKVKA